MHVRDLSEGKSNSELLLARTREEAAFSNEIVERLISVVERPSTPSAALGKLYELLYRLSTLVTSQHHLRIIVESLDRLLGEQVIHEVWEHADGAIQFLQMVFSDDYNPTLCSLAMERKWLQKGLLGMESSSRYVRASTVKLLGHPKWLSADFSLASSLTFHHMLTNDLLPLSFESFERSAKSHLKDLQWKELTFLQFFLALAFDAEDIVRR